MPADNQDGAKSAGRPPAPSPRPRRLVFAAYAFALLPVLALAELAAHAVEVRGTVPDDDYKAAAQAVGKELRDDDLVIFAPGWSDPVGRMHFGALVTPERAAFTDVSRFARAFEVSQGGATRPELAWFQPVSETRHGSLVVRRLDNPRYEKVIDDLLDHVGPDKMTVHARTGANDAECRFVVGGAAAGIWGPATPVKRFQCGHGHVGVVTMPDLAYTPRRCIYAPATDGATRLRITFLDVKFGAKIRFSHGIHVEGERAKKGAPVEAVFKVPVETKGEGEHEKTYGRAVHRDGDGWSTLDVDTRELAGNTGDLVVELHATSAQERKYCFAGTTR